MAIGTRRMTAEEFEQFVELPHNADRLFELVGGEVREVVSNQRSSSAASRISGFLFMYLLQNEIGFLTGSDGGYVIAGERYIPDVAFVSKKRQPEPSDQAYSPNPPDLAVEVLSPSNDPDDIQVKINNYLLVGTVVWLVNPVRQHVTVFTPGQAAQRVGVDGSLSGGDILPGFTLAVKDIFPE